MTGREIGIKFLEDVRLLEHDEVRPGMIVEALPKSEVAIIAKDYFPKNCDNAFGYILGRAKEAIPPLEYRYSDIVVGHLFPYIGSRQYGSGNMFYLLTDYGKKNTNAFLVVGRLINQPKKEVGRVSVANIRANAIFNALEHGYMALSSYEAETLEKKLYNYVLKRATKEYAKAV